LHRGFYLLGFNLLYGCILVALIDDWSATLNTALSSKPLRFLGSISYALYLVHVPVRGALLAVTNNEYISTSPLWVQLSYFGGSIMAAYLSLILIESRFEKLKYRFPLSPNRSVDTITATATKNAAI
jgi:peptidoglycan/LPS O-acetylase OafA/YrhL